MMKKILIPITISLMITACGGGGGGGGGGTTTNAQGGTQTSENPKSSSSSSQEAINIVIEKSSVTIDEDTSTNLTVGTGNVTGATYTVESTDTSVKGSVTDGILKITASKVDSDKDVSLSVNAQKGGVNSKATIVIHVNNASAKALLEDATKILSQKDSLINLSEETAVFNFVNNLAFKSGYATRSETKSSSSAFNIALKAASADAKSALDKLAITQIAYTQGSATEVQLRKDFDDAIAILNKNGKIFIEKINAAINITKGPFAISASGYNYALSVSKYSQFFGNPTLGKDDGGQWKFSQTYDYLNGLLNNASCSI
jgi:hypothetical protein